MTKVVMNLCSNKVDMCLHYPACLIEDGTKKERSIFTYTPYANMADHSVVAWNELYESEASWATVFCFDKLRQKSLRDLDWFISLCLRVCHQKGVKSSTGKKVFFVSLFASEGKTDEGKEFDPIHGRVNGKSLFATFQARRS